MNRTYPKILRNRKQRIARRLEAKRRWPEQPQPMLSARNIHFEMAQRGRPGQNGGYAGFISSKTPWPVKTYTQ